MKLSTKSHYGLQVCYLLGLQYGKENLSATILEKEIHVSRKYIEQIMRILSKRNIVSASRGVQGGYFLVKTPEETNCGEIVRALEDDMEIIGCVTKPCKSCPTSAVWKKLYNGINEILDGISIQNIIEDFLQK